MADADPASTVPFESRALASAASTLIGDFRDELRTLTSQRGTLRGQEPLPPELLRDIDGKIQSLIMRTVAILPHDTAGLSQLYLDAKTAHDEARLHAAEQFIGQHALLAGLAQGRSVDEAAVAGHRAAIEAYRSTHRDLLCSYEGLSAKVDALVQHEEQRGINMRLDADKIAMSISIALRRFMPDAKTLYDALDNKTALELDLIRQAYEQRYGESLASSIESNFARPGLGLFLPIKAIKNRALHLLENNTAAATADALFLAVASKFSKPFHAIEDIIRRTPPEVLDKVPEQFRQLYEKEIPKFERAFSKFSALERAIIYSLLEGRTADADALSIERGLKASPAKHYRVYQALERAGPESRLAVHCAYDRLVSGRTFDGAIAAMPPSPAKDRTRAILSGDQQLHQAACVRCALERLGNVSIIALFEGLTLEQRREYIASYERVYQQDFFEDASVRLSAGKLFRRAHRAKYDLPPNRHREDAQPDGTIDNSTASDAFDVRVQRLAAGGTSDAYYLAALCSHQSVSRAEKLWRSVSGVGTDEFGIKRVLTGLTRGQIEELKHEYAALSAVRCASGKPEDLERRLRLETSGDAWHDIERLLQGVPTTAEETYSRLLSRHQHERSGPWIRRVDLISREGGIMDRDVQAAARYYAERIEGRSPAADERTRFETLVRFAQRDMVGFRITKNDWSDFLANTSSAVVAIASVFPLAPLTQHIQNPFLHIAALGAAAGVVRGVSRLGMKAALKGDGYGREEILRDLIVTGVEASTVFLSRFLPISVLRKPLDIGANMGLKAIIRLGETGDLDRVPAHALKLRDLHRAFAEDSTPQASKPALRDSAGELGNICALSGLDRTFENSLELLR